MPFVTNIGGGQLTYSLGSIIALVVLILCVVLAVVGAPVTNREILGLMAALALSRLC